MFKTAITLFVFVGISLLVTGGVYLSADEFMPYHSRALQVEWQGLEPNFQGLILGFLKGLGGGAFVAGGSILWMARTTLSRDSRSFDLLMPFVAVSYSALLSYATYTVYTSTPGKPPLVASFVLVATSLLASAMLVHSRRNNPADGAAD